MRLRRALGLAVMATVMMGSVGRADFIFDSTLTSVSTSPAAPATFMQHAVDITTPVLPLPSPFGADVSFGDYKNTQVSGSAKAFTLTDVFTINFTDVDSGLSKIFTVTIHSDVAVSRTATGFVNTTFVISDPTFTLGNTDYTITLPSRTPTDNKNGTYGFKVLAVTRAVPEPGSLALLGLGGFGAIGIALRRRLPD